MSGGSGSVVTLQTPWSSFCMAARAPVAGEEDPLALGARKRNVTRPSFCTSGKRRAPIAEVGRPAGGPAPDGRAATERRAAERRIGDRGLIEVGVLWRGLMNRL